MFNGFTHYPLRSAATVGHDANKSKSNPFDRKVFDATSVTIVGKHAKPNATGICPAADAVHACILF